MSRTFESSSNDPSSPVSQLQTAGDVSARLSELNPRRPRVTTLLAYGSVALPLCLAEIPIVLYLPAFYAQELGLLPAVVGLVFLIARLWDGLSDLCVGWLSDRTTAHLGRRKTWVLFGAPFLMASTWFLCHPHGHPTLVYLSVWAALFYTSFTAVKIPHLSLGTELATDYVERSRVTSFREAFTMLGNLFFVLGPLIFLPADAPLRDVLLMIALTTVISVPLSVLALGMLVPDPRLQTRHAVGLGQDLIAVIRDRILLRFVFARLVFSIEEGITNSLLVFSLGIGLGLPNKLFWVVFIIYASTFCALPITVLLTRTAEKHKLLAAGVGMQGLAFFLIFWLPPGHFALAGIFFSLVGLANAAMLSMPTAILADIVDHGELLTGERRAGAYVALDNLVYKLGMALGVGFSFGLLGVVHFDPASTVHTSVDTQHLKLLGFGLPSALCAIVAALYLQHPITKKIQRENRERLSVFQS